MDLENQRGFASNKNITILIGGLAIIVLLFFAFSKQKNENFNFQLPVETAQAGSFTLSENLKWQLPIDSFEVAKHTIKNNQFFGEVLQNAKIPYPTIESILANTKEVFDVNHWKVGKDFWFLNYNGDTAASYLVYEPNVYSYYTFDLKNGTGKKIDYPVHRETKTASGVIKSSLWQSMMDANMSFDLAAKMENALQWSVDFYHTQKGDQFKAYFIEESINGKVVGVGDLYAATYKTGETEFQAVYFNSKTQPGYYDFEGRPMNKGFLKSPVKYSRISSRFNRRRFHPILKRVKPHLGTDYAAPYGTPIMAVGDGVVIEATRRGGNGKFVKIKHDKTYQTQYLHMQKFAKGISSGVQVKQGQTIGYVGSTGLATGPHVCFRFWKNGKQVNHMRLEFPPPKPLPAGEMDDFEKVRDAFAAQLNEVDYPSLVEEEIKIEETEEAVLEEEGVEVDGAISNP